MKNNLIYAEDLKTRDDVIALKPGDFVQARKNGFMVKVDKIVCAMGGDMTIWGHVRSYMPHPYTDIIYGTPVIWGPKGICRDHDIYRYLNQKFVARQ